MSFDYDWREKTGDGDRVIMTIDDHDIEYKFSDCYTIIIEIQNEIAEYLDENDENNGELIRDITIQFTRGKRHRLLENCPVDYNDMKTIGKVVNSCKTISKEDYLKLIKTVPRFARNMLTSHYTFMEYGKRQDEVDQSFIDATTQLIANLAPMRSINGNHVGEDVVSNDELFEKMTTIRLE